MKKKKLLQLLSGALTAAILISGNGVAVAAQELNGTAGEYAQAEQTEEAAVQTEETEQTEEMTEQPDATKQSEEIAVQSDETEAVKETTEQNEETQTKTDELRQELLQLLEQKTVMATVYLTDLYEVREEPDADSAVEGSLPSGSQVLLKDVAIDGGSVWYYVMFAVDGQERYGYIDASHLVTSDTDFRAWEEKLGAADEAAGEKLKKSGNQDILAFPESYRAALTQLKASHPNWTFVPMQTNLEWSSVVSAEMQNNRSWVHQSKGDNWKAEAASQSGWYIASQAAVEYCLDPRNFTNDSYIFMFEQLTYNAQYHTVDAVSNIVSGSFMQGEVPEAGTTYAQAFYDIGNSLGVSPFFLACRVYQEQGSAGTSPLISGTYPGYEGYYNYYNIGAYKTASMSAVTRGLWYASRSGSYQRPWDGHFASLLGGALFYSENYVKQNKNTLYFKKWNVMNGLEDVGEGQYMTNVQGAESEAAALRKGYLSLLDSPMIFEIPIYSGMPDAACRKPSGNNASSQPELPKEEEPKIKKEQTVTTNYTRYTRKVTDKGFNLNAKTDGDGVLTYASSDDRIASVDQSGQVRVNGVEGVVTFTVSASETETCKAGSKIVTLTVKKSEEQQEAERLQKMLTLADAIRLKASSTKNAGGSIQVKLTITQGDIAAIEDLGYTVKYKYYRSEKKNADYRSKVEKQTLTPYVNTAGIKNTRYYYKSRVMIYDADGSLAAYTRLDRCSYACRIWTKE